MPAMIFNKVLLPQPLGPTMVVKEPFSTGRVTSLRARTFLSLDR